MMYNLVSLKESPSLYLNSKVRTEELKKSDMLFLNTGIEEADVEPSIDRLKLRDHPDYIEIKQEYELKQMKFMQGTSHKNLTELKAESVEQRSKLGKKK